MILCSYVGMRFTTGGGCLVYPTQVDGQGVREIVKAHSFRPQGQLPLYDVEILFPLLARVMPGEYQDPRNEEPLENAEAPRPLPPPDFMNLDQV